MTRFDLPDGIRKAVDARLRAWEEAEFARRLWAKDTTLWSNRPLPELADRLGWLALPEAMSSEAAGFARLAEEVRAEGFRHVMLLGMGGSSLAPEVFQRVFGNAAGFPGLTVLDSTHPDAVRAALAAVDVRRTLFIVSSKSGTTLETLSFFRTAWAALEGEGARRGRHFIAITDPGTPLAALAHERAFRRVFAGPPDVGGRYSALSAFGLVPAALIGADVGPLLERARALAARCSPAGPGAENPGLALGAALGEMALAGRDKVTFLTSPTLAAFPGWLEQLIAESLGKEGKGIVPVAEEPDAPIETYGRDRVFVALRLGANGEFSLDHRLAALANAGHPVLSLPMVDAADLGGEMLRWEIAVAAAGAVLGVHPFDQPDVELAKELARRAMKGEAGSGRGAGAEGGDETVAAGGAALAPSVSEWLSSARPGDYVAIHAYLAPAADTRRSLDRIRAALLARTRCATTLGFGPRFLHSTGQLHKGGSAGALFLQIVDEPRQDLAVPESDFTFGALVRAQAIGDLRALRESGRRVLRVSVGADLATGLAALEEAIHAR